MSLVSPLKSHCSPIIMRTQSSNTLKSHKCVSTVGNPSLFSKKKQQQKNTEIILKIQKIIKIILNGWKPF